MDGCMCLEGARGVFGARAGRGGEVVQMIRVLYLKFPGRGIRGYGDGLDGCMAG